MRFFAELKKAYASIEAMSAVPEGGGVWIYDNFYLIKRSYSDICASSKAIRRFLKEKDSDRLLSLLDGFLFKYDFRSPFDKLLAYLRGQRYVYSSQFLSIVPVLLRALALPEHLSTAALLDVLGTLTTREELVEECNKIVANRE